MSLDEIGARVSAARDATLARGETFYPGASRVHLAAFPPKERWDNWTDVDSRRVPHRSMLVPTTCFNCESACGLLAYVDRDTLQVHTTWGTYYIAVLFGDPARAVLYLRALPDDPRLIQEVRDLARARGRPLLLTSGRRWERLQTPAVDAILGRPSRVWRFGEWSVVEYAVGADGPAR